ncbi:MAG TPA: enoyl-CoA hydratase-related protein, partial [Flavihumibacter sp.]
MQLSTILTQIEEGILTITINRPDKLNALNKTVIEELSKVLDAFLSNQEWKAALITGAGPKSFVAGADISEFLELNAAGGEALAARGQELVFNKIEQSHKPIIAAVNGFALGGGCELAMACHFRLAAENARFGQPEVNLGLIPGYGGTQRLTQLIGKGKAMELMMTGAMINAQEALQWGLINHITPAEELIPKAKELLKTIITKAPLAIREVIRLTNIAALGQANG